MQADIVKLNDQKFHAFLGGMFRAAFLVALIAATAFSQPLEYPSAKKGKVVDDYFGTKVPDPYRWLENPDSPETIAWVEAENKITSAYMAKLPDRAAFREELRKLLNYERFGVPKWGGGCYIYTKNDGLQNQSVLFKLKILNGTPEILLDPNQFARDGSVAVTSTAVSNDGRYLARPRLRPARGTR
jgi:prolyl oligopeptidase